MIFLSAVLLSVTTTCLVPPTEEVTQISLSYEAFDSRPGPYGWRALNGADCTDAAVSLLMAYAAANDTRLTGDQRRELAFHTGQTLAFAGRDGDAIARSWKSNLT